MDRVIKSAALAAGKVILRYFKKELSIGYKKSSHKVLVTKADIEAQNVVRKTVVTEMAKKGFPEKEIGFLGEENLDIKGKHTFIVDPLDGTTNFASGIPYFSVSIAYVENNVIKAGAIYNPATGEYFSATLGRGSYLGKKRLKIVSKPLKESVVNTFFNSPKKIYRRQLDIYGKLFPKVRAFRNFGSASLDIAAVSLNRFNLYINGHSFIWDVAAAKLIIEEAGGSIVDWQGQPLNLDLNQPEKEYTIIAGHPLLTKKVLSFI